ncbi:ABC transporter substrate-binding protein [Clostridium sp.]|uniref:ABC transporter substrate-binding protein n=1 Tax=Clostridium sp. TaxID=1506 RepID=UPI0039954FA3
MKRKVIVVLATLCLVTSLVSCGGGESKGTSTDKVGATSAGATQDLKGNESIKATNPEKLPKVAQDRKDTIVIGMSAPKGEFLPIYSSTTYDAWVGDIVFSKLISNDKEGNAIPSLAEKFDISEDGKTYKFTLRKGVKFTNGEEVKAKDVAFTYTTLCDPSYDGPRSSYVEGLVGYEEYNKGDAKNVAGIKVVDDYNIEFTLKESDAPGIWNFVMGIMSESVYKFEKGNIQPLKEKMTKLKLIGSGPYKFVHFKPGQEVKLVKNDNYFEGAPKIPNVVLKVTNGTTQIQELVTGNVDIEHNAVQPKPENIEQLKAAGFLTEELYQANSYGYMGLNLESPKLKDKAVRQALAYGLNRKAFMDSYYQGYGEVANTHILPTSWAFNKEVKDLYPYDPEKANKMLDEAGWKDTNNNGIRDKDGVELEISWLTYTGSKYVDTLTPIVIDSWKQIGVKVVPELMEFSSMADKVRNDRDFEMYNMAWSMDLDPDSVEIFAIEQDKKGGFNSNRWRNEKADKLLKDAKKALDKNERIKLYGEWQKEFAEDLPYIVLGYSKDMSVVSSRVKNFEPSTFIDWTYQIHKMELE